MTNVLKLHWLSGGDINNRRNDIPGQISIYKRGVGGISHNAILKKIGLVGMLRFQTRPMHRMLEKVYEKGDELYIIGFSRGASSARKFVTELQRRGIRTTSGERVKEPPVELLGCFDTVSAQIRHLPYVIISRMFGWIVKSRVVGERGGKIPPIVKKAVHNIALDDNRFQGFFATHLHSPVYMDSGDDRVHEIWVAGEHGDSGGSLYTKGMPDFSCKAMQEWLENEGIKFIEPEQIHPDSLKIDDFPDVVIDKMDLDIAPNPKDKLHMKGPQITRPSYRPVTTVTNQKKVKGGTVRIHVSVLKHMEAMKEKGTPYVPNPGVKDTDLVVVGALDNVLKEETKRFIELIRE